MTSGLTHHVLTPCGLSYEVQLCLGALSEPDYMLLNASYMSHAVVCKYAVSVQAIKDAEADERVADQLAALQLTLAQLAKQEEAGDAGKINGEAPDGGDPAGPSSTRV